MYIFKDNSNEFKESGYILYDNECFNASFHAFYYCVFNLAINYLIQYSESCFSIKINNQKELLREYQKRRDKNAPRDTRTALRYHEWVINEIHKNFSGSDFDKRLVNDVFLMIKKFRTQADYNHVLITKDTLNLVNPKIKDFTTFFSKFEYLEQQLNEMLLNEK